MNICISTFPRSGSSFLQEYLNTCTNIPTKKDHRFVYRGISSDTKSLMIVRKPFDSIASVVAMDRIGNDEDSIEELISRNIKRYLAFYNLIDNYDIIIAYEDLIDKTDEVVEKICTIVGGHKNNNPYISNLKSSESLDRKSGPHPSAYVVSSKGLEEYDEIVKALSLYDLSACNDAYANAHSKIS